jgi:hypothetical protein
LNSLVRNGSGKGLSKTSVEVDRSCAVIGVSGIIDGFEASQTHFSHDAGASACTEESVIPVLELLGRAIEIVVVPALMNFLSNNEDVSEGHSVHGPLEFELTHIVSLSESVHEVSDFIDDTNIACSEGSTKVAISSCACPAILVRHVPYGVCQLAVA